MNADFAQQAIFLAQQLDCSENYLASILHQVTTENPNIGPVSCMELTVANYHQRRRDLVDSLRFLLDATVAASLGDVPENYQRIARFVETEILPGTRTSTSIATLSRGIFKEIEDLDVEIGKADTARKNAGSNTVPPNSQGEHCSAFVYS